MWGLFFAGIKRKWGVLFKLLFTTSVKMSGLNKIHFLGFFVVLSLSGILSLFYQRKIVVYSGKSNGH